MAKHRTHSIEFKRQVVQEFLGGESLHALARRHGIGRNLRSGSPSSRPVGSTATRRPPMCWPSMRRALRLSSVSLASSRLRTSFKGGSGGRFASRKARVHPLLPARWSLNRRRMPADGADALNLLRRAAGPADRRGTACEWPAYGYRRVTAELHGEGRIVNHKKGMRLVKENGLTVRPRRRFIATTDSDHDGPIFPNLAENVVPTDLNQLWVADITYIAIATGFVYLAAILDAWSRRVVGYAIGKRVDARLALAALRAAIAARRPPRGCIHHSDRGSQYAAEDYRAELAKHGLKGSMGRRGNPYDNAKAESFIKTLKVEEVYL